MSTLYTHEKLTDILCPRIIGVWWVPALIKIASPGLITAEL